MKDDAGGGGRLLFWGAIGLSALLLGAALLGRDGLLAVLVNRGRVERLRDDIASLQGENLRLRREIRSLRSDLTSIERIAREDLGLVKPGETVYEFLPAGGRAAARARSRAAQARGQATQARSRAGKGGGAPKTP